ncbi:Protein of unknown function [Pyronema omphalodes CBS 100304]|uniref:Uncharacterized protein n=1 Tax=Pyronema omphalodes (strain CBS 100304) TaxID=1076935 RepID=U4L713_PYROM|nr:Protein of unknown function [Pyronema omphalodes CBS 100304]
MSSSIHPTDLNKTTTRWLFVLHSYFCQGGFRPLSRDSLVAWLQDCVARTFGTCPVAFELRESRFFLSCLSVYLRSDENRSLSALGDFGRLSDLVNLVKSGQVRLRRTTLSSHLYGSLVAPFGCLLVQWFPSVALWLLISNTVSCHL